MKALSTILAMILIVIIVVALIGLTYAFAHDVIFVSTPQIQSLNSSMTSKIIGFMREEKCNQLYINYDGRLACQFSDCVGDYCKYAYKYFKE